MAWLVNVVYWRRRHSGWCILQDRWCIAVHTDEPLLLVKHCPMTTRRSGAWLSDDTKAYAIVKQCEVVVTRQPGRLGPRHDAMAAQGCHDNRHHETRHDADMSIEAPRPRRA